jgi:hypothetical protein
MPKKFFTDKDIEELHRKGIKSLQMNDDVVLTDLAYEKAKRLGLQLIYERADNPPAAPVRPYLSDKEPALAKPVAALVSQAGTQPSLTQQSLTPAPAHGERESNLEKRIRDTVTARLGNQVDSKLLDAIIKRVVKATGLK